MIAIYGMPRPDNKEETSRPEAAMERTPPEEERMQIETAAVQPLAQTIQDPAAAPAAESLAGRIATGFKEVLHGIDKSEAYVDRVVRLASAGRDFSPAELIAIQAGVYRYAQELEALSKLVDATTGCVRRTLEAAG